MSDIGKKKEMSKGQRIIALVLMLLSLYQSVRDGERDWIFFVVFAIVFTSFAWPLVKPFFLKVKGLLQKDNCPKPICFHKDKGEHNVRKGKEIDPWDRPDIDIYNRNP